MPKNFSAGNQPKPKLMSSGTWVFKGKGSLRDMDENTACQEGYWKNKERTEKTEKIWTPNQIPPRQTVFAVEARAPVKENQEIEVAIDDNGSRGDGVARIQGHFMFVPCSRKKERVRVRIRSVNEKFALKEIA